MSMSTYVIENMTRDEKIEVCAEAAYEAHRVLCRSVGERTPPPWADAKTVWLIHSINFVKDVIVGDGPSMIHARWMSSMKDAGWKRAAVKDVSKKQLTTLVSYNELPGTTRRKYVLAVDTIRAMAKALDLEIKASR